MRPTVTYLRLPKMSALSMLHLEECLFRGDAQKRNYVFTHQLTPGDRAVILGLSGKPELLVHEDACREDRIPLIQRHTGGGTVFVDEKIKFVSFVMNKESLPNVAPFPSDIMKWTERVYRTVFHDLASTFPADFDPAVHYRALHPPDHPDPAEFSLRENDYCFGNLKFGGNAQSIVSARWVHVRPSSSATMMCCMRDCWAQMIAFCDCFTHSSTCAYTRFLWICLCAYLVSLIPPPPPLPLQHTSFLWELDSPSMRKYLKMPAKRPVYRGDREHGSFLCPLKPFFPPLQVEALSTPDKDQRFEEAIVRQLNKWFHVRHVEFEADEIQEIIASNALREYRTKLLPPSQTQSPPQPQLATNYA